MGFYARLCRLVGRSVGWSVCWLVCWLVTPFFASYMYWHVHVREYLQHLCCIYNTLLRMRHRGVAYATWCRICNTMMHMRHLSVAYATSCRVCNTFLQKTIFLKKSQMKYFSLIRPWFMPVWSKPNWRETWSNMKNVLMVPRIHSVEHSF